MDSDFLRCVFLLLILLFVAVMAIKGSNGANRLEGRESKKTRTTFGYDLNYANVYEMLLPKGISWEPEKAKAFLDHLLVAFDGRLLFRIVAEPGRVVWQIVDCRILREDVNVVIQAIESIYPEAEVSVSAYSHPELTTAPIHRWVIPLELGGDFVTPIKMATEIKRVDPLASFVQAVSTGLEEGERFIYTCYISSQPSDSTVQEGLKRIQRSTINPLQFFALEGWIDATVKGMTQSTRTGKYVPEQQRIFEHKLRYEKLWNVYLLLQFDSINPTNVSGRLQNAASILFSQFGSDFNVLLPHLKKRDKPWKVDTSERERNTSAIGLIGKWIDGADDLHRKVKAVLSTEELAGLWHLPHEGFTAPNIAFISSGRVPKKLLQNSEGIVIGDNTGGVRVFPVRMHPEDRNTHVSIIGKTGVGKSTIMHNMIHQDIADGKGIAVVDPHGRLVRDIMRVSIPDERIGDVCLIDIANEEEPPALNPMRVPGGDLSLIAGQVVAILTKVDQYGLTDRIAGSLTNAIQALRFDQEATFQDIERLFEDAEYRSHFIYRLDDIVARNFWSRYSHLSRSEQESLAGPVLYRAQRFYRHPVMRRMMCHPYGINFSQLMRQGKIILISLGIEELKLPDIERQLIGAMVVSQLEMHHLLAAKQTRTGRLPFALYVDEVQNFTTTSLDKIFAEARKYDLQLTVGNQYLGQLKGDVLESIMGTVGAMICFQIGLNDARTLAPYFRPAFEAEDLMSLSKFHAVVKMRLQGETLPAFSIATRPVPDDVESPEALKREKMIREIATRNCGPEMLTKYDVQAWLDRRYPLPEFGFDEPDEGGDWVDRDE